MGSEIAATLFGDKDKASQWKWGTGMDSYESRNDKGISVNRKETLHYVQGVVPFYPVEKRDPV